MSREQEKATMLQELERPESIGMVLVVLAAESLDSDDPQVAMIQELQSKDATERQAGQLSLPAETRKVDEDEAANLMAAVAELTDSDEVIGKMMVIPDRLIARGLIRVNGMPADVGFIIFDGPTDIPLKPVNGTEVENAGWQSISSIQRMNGEVRPLSHDSLDRVISGGILESIRANRDQAVPLSRYLDSEFSIVSFVEEREANQVDLLQ